MTSKALHGSHRPHTTSAVSEPSQLRPFAPPTPSAATPELQAQIAHAAQFGHRIEQISFTPPIDSRGWRPRESIQPKLTLRHPDAPEADRAAVSQMPAIAHPIPQLQRTEAKAPFQPHPAWMQPLSRVETPSQPSLHRSLDEPVAAEAALESQLSQTQMKRR